MDFLCRTVFVWTMPREYLGVQGLFQNILTLLSLSELGIGTVICYSMYRPMASADKPKMLALISFYQRTYRLIALFIGAVGLLLVPFLPYLIKDCPDIPHLSLIYILYLANTSLSYLFAGKQVLFLAEQKLYVTNGLNCLFVIVKDIVRIILLLTTHNFILYLAVSIPFTVLTNWTTEKLAEKQYPFLSGLGEYKLTRQERQDIFKNIFAMFNHRTGATILNSTDNLLISRMIGLAAVAVNNNYVLITNMVTYLMNHVFSALTASVGNYVATEKKEDSYRIFSVLHFAGFWFYTFCTAGLLVLLNPFIRLVWGEQYVFEFPVTAIICINFYLVGIRKIPIIFKESMGLLRQDRYKPFVEAAMNLVLSVILARFLGVFGIFLGSFLSMALTSLWVEPYVLFHYGFCMSGRGFWRNNIIYFAFSAFAITASCYVGTLYDGGAIAEFLYKILVCLVVPNLLLLVCFWKSPLLRELIGTLKRTLRR